MAITRTPILDDDGNGETGTVIDNAWKQEFYDQIDGVSGTGAWLVIPATITGTVHDWAPAGLARTTVIEWSGAGADLLLTGISGGVAGALVTIKNTSLIRVASCAHNTGSASVNRFYNIATSAPTPIGPGGAVTYVHDGSLWVMTALTAGAWIVPPYSAAHFAGTGGMTWTVDAGDITTLSYVLVGKMLTVTWQIASSSIGGTPSMTLTINNGQWGGFTVTRSVTGAAGYLNNGAVVPGYLQVVAGATTIGINKNDGSAFAASTNTTYVYGTISFEVN